MDKLLCQPVHKFINLVFVTPSLLFPNPVREEKRLASWASNSACVKGDVWNEPDLPTLTVWLWDFRFGMPSHGLTVLPLNLIVNQKTLKLPKNSAKYEEYRIICVHNSRINQTYLWENLGTMSVPVKHRCTIWESLAFEHMHKFQNSLSRTWEQNKPQKNTTEGTKKVKKLSNK